MIEPSYGQELSQKEAESNLSEAQREFNQAEAEFNRYSGQGGTLGKLEDAKRLLLKAENGVVRANRIATLSAEKAEEQKKRDQAAQQEQAAAEAKLKQSYLAAWLSAPGATVEGFEKNWPIMRDKYYREQAASQMDEVKKSLLATGLYSGF